MTDFWHNARPLLDKKGVRHIDLAQLTGRANATVSDWFNKGVLPRVDDAVKIADLLGVSVHYLVTGVERTLSEREGELLRTVRLLNDDKFDIVLQTARIMRKDMDRDLSGGLSSQGLGEINGN